MSDRKPLNFGFFFSEDSIETPDMEKGIKDYETGSRIEQSSQKKKAKGRNFIRSL